MDENIFYPELTLETDDIIMELAIKKDYSKIRDSDKRKEEFIKDLHDFIDEFIKIKAKIHFLAILITYSIRFKSILSNDFMVSISICPGAVTSRPAAKVIGESNLEAITLV